MSARRPGPEATVADQRAWAQQQYRRLMARGEIGAAQRWISALVALDAIEAAGLEVPS